MTHASSQVPRSALSARLDELAGSRHRATGCAGRCRGSGHSSHGRDLPLRVQPSAHLVGRIGHDHVPLARHARLCDGAASRPAHADDRGAGSIRRSQARSSRGDRECGAGAVSRVRSLAVCRVRAGPIVRPDAGARPQRRASRIGSSGRRRAHAGGEPDPLPEPWAARRRTGARGPRRHCGHALSVRASDPGDGQLEPRRLLSGDARGRRAGRRADRVLFRPLHGRLSSRYRRRATGGHSRPHRRRRQFAHSACSAAVHSARLPHRDDAHGDRDGQLSRRARRPCRGRTRLRAARRHAARLRHFRGEDRRHGRRRAGAVSRHEEARHS